jgi:DNA-binding CsgD family transcriptional regulator
VYERPANVVYTGIEARADDILCLVGLGEFEQASRQVEELAALMGPLVDPAWRALLARTRGALAGAHGDSSSALAHFDEAVELLESLPEGWPYELARTLLIQGSAQRRAREKLKARETLERALEIFERLGARAWAEKTRAELRQIGGRPMSTRSLTEAERRVAELVAAGRSNAAVARELSLSPKTVEWNLSKIYRKLQVRSRTELAAKLARRQTTSM